MGGILTPIHFIVKSTLGRRDRAEKPVISKRRRTSYGRAEIADKNHMKKRGRFRPLFNLKYSLLIARTVETPVPTLISLCFAFNCDFGFTPVSMSPITLRLL